MESYKSSLPQEWLDAIERGEERLKKALGYFQKIEMVF